MLIVTLTGPMASGKTLMHEIIKKHKAEAEQMTGHKIFVKEVLVKEVLEHDLPTEDCVFPAFRVMRFKASGKWMDTFNITARKAKNMQDIAELLRKAKNMPRGGSMVVVAPLTEKADAIFYPIEVKDESSSNR